MNRTSCLNSYVNTNLYQLGYRAETIKKNNTPKHEEFHMAKKISISNILFIALTLSLIFPIQADATLIGGQVFTDEGLTPIADG